MARFIERLVRLPQIGKLSSRAQWIASLRSGAQSRQEFELCYSKNEVDFASFAEFCKHMAEISRSSVSSFRSMNGEATKAVYCTGIKCHHFLVLYFLKLYSAAVTSMKLPSYQKMAKTSHLHAIIYATWITQLLLSEYQCEVVNDGSAD